MKSTKNQKVTAALLAATALGGVAHAAPSLNMSDLVGTKSTAESKTTTPAAATTSAAAVQQTTAQPTAPSTTQPMAASVQSEMQQGQSSTPTVSQANTPRNTIDVTAIAQPVATVQKPQYTVDKNTHTVMEPTLAMHSLMNVQRQTEQSVVEKQVDGKPELQKTQIQRAPVVQQEPSTAPLPIARTTTTKSVVAKQKLTIRDIQRAERERLEKEALEQAALEAQQQQLEEQNRAAKVAEAQRQAALKAQQEQLAAQQAEARRQASMKAEQERIASQQIEAQRQEALKAEQERIAAQQAEHSRIAEEQRIAAEQERLRIQEEQRRMAEQKYISAQQAEAQRQAALKAEQEQLAAQQAEAQRQAALKAQQEQLAAQQAEAQRQTALKAEQERIAAQQAEQERLAAQQRAAAAEKAKAEREAALKVQQERMAAQQAEAQRQAALKAQQEQLAAQQAEAQQQAALKAEQERIAAQQAEAQRQAALKAEQERIAAQQAEQERLAAQQRAAAAEKAKAEREAAIKAEQERIAAYQAEAQRQAALKAEQERIAAQQAEAQRQAALKAEQERMAAQQAEAQRQAALKAEQERIAAEKAKAEQERLAAEKAKAEEAEKAKAEEIEKAKVAAAEKAKSEEDQKIKNAETTKAEDTQKAKVEETKAAKNNTLPQSYVESRSKASTKGSAVMDEKNILSQPMDPPLQADTSAKINLTFDAKNYETMTGTVDNKTITYRAFEYIPYVSNPIDIDQQYLNIYVPEEYFNNGTINGYTTQTAPIFMPNSVGGYMPSQPMVPKAENGKPNSALYALSRGYVVASPATRGRTNKASDGNYIGKAPAVIVDLQAATAYLHANDAAMPGNANRIITNGTSAGGAVSLLQGAAGNNVDFQPYLQALGAATAPTDVYASSAYAPITNLDAADMAYEWSYNGITSFDKVSMGQGELPQANVSGNAAPPKRTTQRVTLNTDDVAYSNLLKEHFPDYVNNLQLRDSIGRVLRLDKNGDGSFKAYVKAFIIDATNKAQANGTDVSKHTYVIRDAKTGAIKDINWEAYNRFVSRSKAPGAFDSRSNDSGENNLFGTSTSDNNHFTITAALHDTTSNQDVYVENAKIVTMMNPMNYLGSPAATNARYYRIRYGTADSNTSMAIPLIVGTRAQNLGYRVDMATPFNVDHSGDYDLEELFNWMDSIVKNGR
ncbi:subtype B tannase [Veillonella denticariosi]|uniref:subtype B tannase n=1 Tax=Veillonella denticariosi TaxID=419208 RepID=UPI00248FDBF0|nr:subtype B tannase [Veillonella denticariosi]